MDNPFALPLVIAKIAGFGPKSLMALESVGIDTVGRLLFHLPLRYRLKNQLSFVSDFEPDKSFYVEALVVRLQPRNSSMRITVQDSNGDSFSLVFFHFSPWHKQKFSIGTRLLIWGQVREFNGRWEMSHPEAEISRQGSAFEPSIECIYPKVGKVTPKLLSKAFHFIWDKFLNEAVDDYGEFLEPLRLLHTVRLSSQECLDFEKLEKAAKDKLAHLEALHYFSYLHDKEELIREKGLILKPGQTYVQLMKALPFELTQGQKDVLNIIKKSFSQGDLKPRLIQGDVGSGKTIIGFLAMCCAFDRNRQAALMAPTELLARQHYDKLTQLLPTLSESIIYLSGTVSQKQRKVLLEKIKSSDRLLIIGTHALFQQKVDFKNLSVVIIDEQQRFGVNQRAELLKKSKSSKAYQITLTATPIPRTLAMATYGPIELNVLKEKPAGRQDIKTYTLRSDQLDIVYKSVLNCVSKKQQCYWVCPLIQESEQVQASDVEHAYEKLKHHLPLLRIELIHGQIPIDTREAVLKEFKAGKVDILVSTLVIEVGVDSPTASLIVIESPDRLGLSQLHQLRGRVGRGSLPGHCILVYDSALSQNAVERLTALCHSQDGFYLSEVDLKLRGPGEALGQKQTGQAQFKFFDIIHNEENIPLILEQCRSIPKDQLMLLEDFFGACDTTPYV